MPAAAVIPAAIAGGASLIGSIANLFGQSSANERNVELQRETNALNYKMFQESQEFQKAQQQLAMDYNDPAAQAQRLRAAGVNPAAVFDGGSVSEVSAMSAPSSNPMVAPQVKPLDYSGFGESIQFANDAYFRNQLVAAESRKSSADASISETNALMEQMAFENKLAMIANDKSKSDYERDTARITLDILNHTRDALIRQESLKADVLNKQVEEIRLRNDAQVLANKIATIELKWKDKERSAQYQSFMANIKNALASARSHDASAAASYANAALADAQSAGVRIDNSTRERVKDAVVEEAFYSRDVRENEAHRSYWDYRNARKEFIYGRTASGFIPDFRSLFDIRIHP